ncbi:hypothetical protein ADEAN_000370800 [Angomonas deanei]|uniref:Survival motor neuron Tudor domain-containing protein n=1 Tax=Angomonas deanei TaxID=59799 RepID=A0A7G2CBE4_9TRYP|nr:hypothetical protein ADEAN_000370800 [Angomonas deanei]
MGRKPGKKKEEEEVYTKGDTALWDDTELVKLWSEQLEKVQKGEVLPETTSSVEKEDTSAELSEEDASSVSSEESSKNKSVPRGGIVSPSADPLVAHLPSEVRKLVTSFYWAGFEAGVYSKTSRKRSR